MTARRNVLFGIAALFVGAILAADGQAQERTATELLPGSTVFYADIPELGAVIDVLFDHPLREKIEGLPEYRAVTQRKEYIAFQAGRQFIETQLGMNWREAVQGLTAGGVTVAFDPVTEGVAVLVRAKDKATLTHIRDVLMELVRADAESKGKPDPYQTDEYRGVTVYGIDKGGFATVGDRLVVVNKGEFGKAILDRLLDQGRGDSLASNKRFQAAQDSRPGNATAWAWADINWIREAAKAGGKPFQTQTDNPVGELLVGGLLDTFQHTPWLTGTLNLNATQLSLQFRTPHQPEWTTEAREFFFGPNGTGTAPNPPRIDQTLFSLSTYRNVSEMWLRAGDLFPENVVDKLAEADSNLSLFFSGRDFGEDILGAFEPTMQILAARQSFEDERPTPAIKLPAFAVLFQMRDPAVTTRDLKRVFTSFVGFINVTGAMEGNPQLELEMPAVKGYELVSSRFLPRVGEERSREAQIQFNFSPAVAFAGNQFILASTEGLARELASVTTSGDEQSRLNTSIALDGPALRDVLADNESHLITKNMLEEGHTREEAERQIGLFLEALRVLQGASIELTNRDGEVGLDLELRLRDEAVTK